MQHPRVWIFLLIHHFGPWSDSFDGKSLNIRTLSKVEATISNAARILGYGIGNRLVIGQ